MDQDPIDRIRTAIEQHTGQAGRRQGREWRLICPAHPDREPSLMVRETEAHVVLIACMASCDARDVLGAVGLTLADCYPRNPDDRRRDPVVATYSYVDEDGVLLYQVERTVNKKFRQRRPDPDRPGKWLYNLDGVRRVLYRLPLLIEAIREGRDIYVVEGEKDVHTLESLGQVATCNPGGAGKWRPEYSQVLAGAQVTVIEDNDRPDLKGRRAGHEHALLVVQQLAALGTMVTHMRPAVGKDITDQITAGVELDAMLFVVPEIRAEGSEALPVAPEAIDDPTGRPSDEGIETPQRTIRLTKASLFEVRAVQWLWADRMPLGELCLIAGREGVGKSTFLAWMAAAITNGNLEGIYHRKRKAVLVAANEDAWSYTIVPRMIAAGADLDLIYRVDVVEADGNLSGLILPRDCRVLAHQAREVDAAVLMCDPILSMVDETINVNKAQELRRALEPLKRLAEEAEMAVPALAHFNKTQGVDVLSMVAGSRAWTEIARSVISIARDEQAEIYTCVVSQEKNNLGRSNLDDQAYTIENHTVEAVNGQAQVGRLRWLDDVPTQSASQLLNKRRGNGDNEGTSHNTADYITEALEETGRAMTPRDVCEIFAKWGGAASRISYNSVKQRMLQMYRSDRLRRTGGLYALPDQARPNCSVCGEPMIAVTPGAGTHPLCLPE